MNFEEIMKFRFSPFSHPLTDLTSSDLENLRQVSEGWYVEYKSEVIPVKALAKSLSAFANQYGGWLIIGIAENSETQTAGTFPGITEEDAQKLLIDLRNASKDVLNPEVYYETHLIRGPSEDLGLLIDQVIVIVQIPAGADTPYIHSDGRIYRRVADSSNPRPESDRFILDKLWARGEKAKEKLMDFVTKLPTKSKAEENECYIHLSILSDPYETKGDSLNLTFDKFVEIMSENPMPFDNIYTRVDGLVARQAKSNSGNNRLFTWEINYNCHSYITFPLQRFSEQFNTSLYLYINGKEFGEAINNSKSHSCRVLDLNILFDAFILILHRHRMLVSDSGVSGPFYIKANIENAWRTIPFLDLPDYIEHVKKHGVPVVQDENILVPAGTGLGTFILLPDRESGELKSANYYLDAVSDAAKLLPVILEAFGIPRELIKKSVDNFLGLSNNYMNYREKLRVLTEGN